MSYPSQNQQIYRREDLSVLNLLEHPVWIFDIDNKAMWWANTTAISLWSANNLDELLQRNFADDMSEATSLRLAHYLVKFRNGERLKDQWTFYPNGQQPKTVATTASGILIENNRMAMLMEGIYKDVKEDSDKATLRGLETLRHLPIAVCQFDIDGNITYENPQSLAMFGSLETNIPKTKSDATQQYEEEKEKESSSEEDCPENNKKKTQHSSPCIETRCHFTDLFVDKALGKHVLQQVQSGEDCSIDALLHTVRGQQRWAAIQARQTKDPVTTKPIILYSARDITDLVEALKAKRLADSANMAKSEFLAVMAHEIRTPLHQVIGFIELLGGTKLEAKQNEFVRLLQNSSSGMMTVINDLLDYTKLEAGKMTMESIPFDPRGVIEGAMAVVRPNAEKKGLRLDGKLMNMPKQLMGDPNRLRQVLFNLLHNAVKFTNAGSVTVSVSVDKTVPVQDNKVMLRFSVTDTGIGVNEEGRKRMFSKYQQADASVAAKYGGTGLGLAICKNLVEAMEGTIGLDSELGQGSKFWFSLPFQCPTLTDVMEQYTDSQLTDGTTTNKKDKKKILLVEDNVVNQKLMVSMLDRLGHDVTAAVNGQEAVDMVQEKKFDLVLMDLQMPVMDGIEATRCIRELGFAKSELPILALTASVRSVDHESIGINGWLTKPLRVRELREAIQRSPQA